ncbi:hypothetical protein R3P38DRAFT_890353 [Favolaschia claudopus]|uniref:Uncharacterized protein n=1 Tax=Favolaschia claudopus TaxID=2862362 RepID=A0AAW0BUH0_9AGAR
MSEGRDGRRRKRAGFGGEGGELVWCGCVLVGVYICATYADGLTGWRRRMRIGQGVGAKTRTGGGEEISPSALSLPSPCPLIDRVYPPLLPPPIPLSHTPLRLPRLPASSAPLPPSLIADFRIGYLLHHALRRTTLRFMAATATHSSSFISLRQLPHPTTFLACLPSLSSYKSTTHFPPYALVGTILSLADEGCAGLIGVIAIVVFIVASVVGR